MISGLGYPSYMYTEESKDGSTYYFAQMGSYASIIDAIDAANALNKKVKVQYDVVHTNTNTIVQLGSGSEKTTSKPVEPKQPETKSTSVAEDKTAYDEPIIAAPEAPAVTAPKAPSIPKTPQTPEQPRTPGQASSSQKTPAAAPAPAKTQAEAEKIYLLQLFSFQVQNNAIQTAKNYKSKGYDAKIMRLFDSQNKEWFVVSVGYAKTQEQAAALADQFAQKEGKRPTLNNVDADFLETRIVPFD